MSVLLGDRKESKFEAITYSIELHDMLILLMQRGFGVKDVDSFVRKKYAYGEISEENFAKYRELMRSFKSKINQCASLITSNVRAANTIYPRTMAHDRIMYLGMSYIDRGCVTQDEYENLRVYLYEPYERMGGNGSAKRIMQEVDKLPIHKFIEKEEEHNEHE